MYPPGPSRAARLSEGTGGAFLPPGRLAAPAPLGIPYRRAIEPRSWPAVPCTITRSDLQPLRIADSAAPEWRVLLAYQYSINGTTLTGTRWRRVSFLNPDDASVSRKSAHREVAEDLTRKYPVGLATTCHVNPLDPAEAVLEHQSKAPIYTLWWPMIFAAGGAGILWSACRQPKRLIQS
jgi:hypothetical protein